MSHQLPAYVPEWAKLDSPTRRMNESELREYYKANAVAGDCRFALRDGSTVPAGLQTVYRAMLDDLQARKATPADKRVIAELRAAWRTAMDGRPYAVPVYARTAKRAIKTPKIAPCCPQCGYVAGDLSPVAEIA